MFPFPNKKLYISCPCFHFMVQTLSSTGAECLLVCLQWGGLWVIQALTGLRHLTRRHLLVTCTTFTMYTSMTTQVRRHGCAALLEGLQEASNSNGSSTNAWSTWGRAPAVQDIRRLQAIASIPRAEEVSCNCPRARLAKHFHASFYFPLLFFDLQYCALYLCREMSLEHHVMCQSVVACRPVDGSPPLTWLYMHAVGYGSSNMMGGMPPVWGHSPPDMSGHVSWTINTRVVCILSHLTSANAREDGHFSRPW
jgi:hypothetical protein